MYYLIFPNTRMVQFTHNILHIMCVFLINIHICYRIEIGIRNFHDINLLVNLK